jgi:2-polyprenyl-3-methyl-5-hydroxy-6-metoxy-1,4-benzoquinol methylase
MIDLHNNCLICGSSKLQDLPGFSAAFLCHCADCKFVFSKKIPTRNELVAHYEQYSRDDYLSPLTIKRYHEFLDRLEPYKKTGNLLDVGCGIGYFLEVAKERGWEVYGTEFTDQAVKICREKGIQMHQGPLDSLNYQEGFFDVLCSFEVIEHINNPLHELNQSVQVMRDGGAYFLTTPNFNSLLRYYLKDKYNVICYPEHLSYYTKSTIKRLFTTNSFKCRYISTTGISITRIKTSSGDSAQAFISSESDDEKIRNKMESSRMLGLMKNTVNYLLNVSGTGDSLKALFELQKRKA